MDIGGLIEKIKDIFVKDIKRIIGIFVFFIVLGVAIGIFYPKKINEFERQKQLAERDITKNYREDLAKKTIPSPIDVLENEEKNYIPENEKEKVKNKIKITTDNPVLNTEESTGTKSSTESIKDVTKIIEKVKVENPTDKYKIETKKNP